MHARKRWVAQNVVGGKYQVVAYFVDDAVMVILLAKVTI